MSGMQLSFLLLVSAVLATGRQIRPGIPPPIINDTTIIFDEKCANGQVRYWPPTGESRCCSQCPPGRGMVKLCTNTTDTDCGECAEGKEFSNVFSDRDKCTPCTTCRNLHSKAKVRQSCTAKNDTVCECIPGFYFDPIGPDHCRPCTKCGPGFGPVRSCSWKNDTICERCPDGFFSAITAATKRCQACQRCGPGEKEAKPCRADANRVCCAKPPCRADAREEVKTDNGQLGEGGQRASENWKDIILYDNTPKNGSKAMNATSLSDKTTVPPGVNKPRGSTSTDLIPLYCALMSLVIISLFAYVAFKYWRRRCRAGAGAKALPGGLLGPGGVFQSTGKRKPAGGPVEDAEGSGVRLMALTPKYSSNTQDSRRTELSSARLAAVEARLPADCWRELAQALEFSSDDLMRMEAQANSLSESPLHVLLHDFSSRPSATSDQLAMALQCCGHHVTASFLLNDVIDEAEVARV